MKAAIHLSYLVVFSLSMSAVAVHAETATNANETAVVEQHGKHEHGVASLSLAVDNKGLEISLDSPAANLVGFEHKPSTDEQSQQVAKVKAQLENPTSLFDIPAAAECSLSKTELQAALMQVSTDTTKADADKHEHEHASEKHEHEHEAEHEEHAHSDIEATWQFTCAKPAELGSVSTKLFATFPAIKKLNVEWLNGDKASAVTLEQDTAVLLK
jgi:hypothetical protein